MNAQLDQISQRQPTRLGQATAVEQARAVAEVEAQIVVAMRHPRNIPAAIAAMRETCGRKELADRAFFRYPRGGQAVSGPSIHLARELARVWGNISYGAAELRRDDDFGQSEMLAFAWDVQTNTRSQSTIINPHRQYTGGKSLTDLRDIYENNANVVARRVREAIFAVLPAWFVEEAKDLCAKTITDGGGIPLPTRIANAIEVFGNLGITVAQLEAKVGQPSPKWTDQDVAHLRVIRQSLMRGEISKEEEFPAAADRVTAAEITGQSGEGEPADAGRKSRTAASPATPKMLDRLNDRLASLPLGVPDEREQDEKTLLEWLCGAEWTASTAQVRMVLPVLESFIEAAAGDLELAVTAIWTRYHEVNGGDRA